MRLTLFIYCFIIQSIIFSQNPNHWLQDTSVYHGQLKNGLSYYIQKNDFPKNKVILKMIVGAGALDEKENEKGLAHFLEHLAFNGTKKYPKKNLEKFLEKNGMKIGSDYNASTSNYHTKYYLTIDNDKEILDKSIEILKEWAFEIKFTKEEIDIERGVILSEKHSHENSRELLSKEIIRTLLENSFFYKNDIIGVDYQIKKFGLADFQSFYKKWYTPNNINLLIIGNVEPKEVEAYIKKYFESYNFKEITHTYHDKISPILKDTAYEFHNEFLLQKSKISAYWHIQREKNWNQDLDFKNDLISQIFQKVLQKRVQDLNDTLVEKIYVSYSNKYNFYGKYNAKTLIFSSDLMIDKAFSKAMNLYNNLLENGIEKKEFETTLFEIKNELNKIKLSTEDLTSGYLMSRLDYKVIREERMLTNGETNKLKRKLIDEIKIDDLQNYINEIKTKMSKKWIYEYKNTNEKGSIESLLKNYYFEPSNAYSDIETFEIDELVTSITNHGEIVQKEIAVDDNMHKLWLNNGSIVILKPNNTRKNKVYIKFQTLPDSFFIPDFDNYKIALYSQIPVGTDSFKMKHLSNYWKKHLLNSSSIVSSKFKSGHVDVYSPNLKYALEQIHFLNSPITWNEKEFELQKERYNSILKNKDTTLYEFEKKINQAIYEKAYLENKKITPEKIQVYNIKEFENIHNKAIENNRFLIAIVGDFEIDTVESLVLKYIASLKNSLNYSTKIIDNFKYNLKSEKIYVQNKKDSLHYFNVSLYNKIKFDNFEDDFIFGTIAKDMINKEIKRRIREENGKIYSAMTTFTNNYKEDSIILFQSILKTHETNTEEVRKELKTIFNEFGQGKIDEKDFDIQKLALKKKIDAEVSSNEKWADLLIKNHIEKRNMKEYLTNRIETFHFDIFQNYLKRFFTNNYEIFGEKGK